jgi:hypothetical protein
MWQGYRFAGRFRSVEETPEPFRRVLLERIWPHESVRLLVHSPPDLILGARRPGTLLAMTDRRWLIVYQNADESTTVAESSFADTLLVKLTTILLYGRLKLGYVAEGAGRCAGVEFSTVWEEYYREAANLVLTSVDDVPRGPASDRQHILTLLDDWPLKFLNAVLRYLPPGHCLREAVHWPAVYGKWHRELAPAAALLLTDRAVLLISEEKAKWWQRFREGAKYGQITTYIPLVRLAHFGLCEREGFGLLGMEIGMSLGREELHVPVPLAQVSAISRFMDLALRRG